MQSVQEKRENKSSGSQTSGVVVECGYCGSYIFLSVGDSHCPMCNHRIKGGR